MNFGGENRLVRSRANALSPRRPSRGKVRVGVGVFVACFTGPDEPYFPYPEYLVNPTRLVRLSGHIDLVQDLYIRELKAYKAPAPVCDIFLNCSTSHNPALSPTHPIVVTLLRYFDQPF